MYKMKKFSDTQIVNSWKMNVQPWISAICENEIESRLLVTNRAIINAILNLTPKSVLDIGCGEGWLVRELEQSGISTLGLDVVPEFIEYAQKQGGGRFKSVSFEELSSSILQEKFDIIVCNFSLLGDESVVHLFQQAASLLNNGGAFIIQTIHPVAGCGDQKYEDGWREGSWTGFSDKFCDPAPWYFRTLDTWKNLFIENNFNLNKILEPSNPKTKTPASIIFCGTLNN